MDPSNVDRWEAEKLIGNLVREADRQDRVAEVTDREIRPTPVFGNGQPAYPVEGDYQ